MKNNATRKYMVRVEKNNNIAEMIELKSWAAVKKTVNEYARQKIKADGYMNETVGYTTTVKKHCTNFSFLRGFEIVT